MEFTYYLQELHTPRSNRSLDSGLPHDDITPRSDSLSTASSSASPPDQHQHHRELQQQHRKSTSMDEININAGNVRIVPSGPQHSAASVVGACQPSPQQPWKSYSLQRGSVTAPTEVAPPKAPSNPIYASTTTNGDGTVVIRRPSSAKGQPNASVSSAAEAFDDEDPYGRCTNMRLTSFADSNGGHCATGNGLGSTTTRDPRIIDLTLMSSSPNSSQNGLNQHYVPPQPQQLPSQSNFNTLPAQVNYVFWRHAWLPF